MRWFRRFESRGRVDDGIIHADHSSQFTSWTFTDRARRAGLLPSLGSVSDPWDYPPLPSLPSRYKVFLTRRQLGLC